MQTWTCTEILEFGSRALRYFDILEVRYLRWVGDAKSPEFKSYNELHTLFYQQNGLKDQPFRDAADALKTVLENVANELNKQATFANALPSMWWGEAATNASNMLATQTQLAQADVAIVRRIYGNMDSAQQALREAVAIKSEAAKQISVSEEITVEGKTPEDIDSIITFAKGFDKTGTGWFGDSLLDKVNRIFPECAFNASDLEWSDVTGEGLKSSGSGPSADTQNSTNAIRHQQASKMRDRCISWLNDTFKAEYESHMKDFVDACNQCNQQVANIYDELVKTFHGLNATKYPCPKVSQTPQATNPAGTTTGQPTGTGTPTTPGTPSTTTPSTTTPSTTTPSTDNPLSTVAALGTQLASSGIGTQLTDGLNGLVSSASQQITSTLEQLREQAENVINPDGDDEPDKDLDGDGVPDQDADGEPDKDLDGDGKPDKDADGDGEPDADSDKGIEFNGQNYKLEVGPDGQLKLVVDSPSGEPVTYKVEIGPDGKPSIVGENPPGEAPPETENQQPAGQPAGVPGAPAGKPQEDVEHQPQNYPPPQDPEDDSPDPEAPAPPPAPPVDTGAQLAEAGPL